MKHGEMRRGQHSREADIWNQMLQRCNNPTCESYGNYGGRASRCASDGQARMG